MVRGGCIATQPRQERQRCGEWAGSWGRAVDRRGAGAGSGGSNVGIQEIAGRAEQPSRGPAAGQWTVARAQLLDRFAVSLPCQPKQLDGRFPPEGRDDQPSSRGSGRADRGAASGCPCHLHEQRGGDRARESGGSGAGQPPSRNGQCVVYVLQRRMRLARGGAPVRRRFLAPETEGGESCRVELPSPLLTCVRSSPW